MKVKKVNMELKRNIYLKLLEWKKQDVKNVLVVKGARQVGKTYILKKFGKENFSKVIYISMAEMSGRRFLKCLKAVRELENITEAVIVRKALSLFETSFIDDTETLIIIDEIQESAEVYNQICATSRDLQARVIVSSSYFGRVLNPEFLSPTEAIDYIAMETLTFYEFLDVFGECKLYENIDLFGKGQGEDYEKLAGYYEIYQKIGGYPAVVVSYAQQKDLNKCYEKIGNLIDVFANESKRYFEDVVDVNIFRKLFNVIALMMMQEKQGVRDLVTEVGKIAYQEESGRMTQKMINHTISWLQESHIIGYASKAIDCDYKQVKENSRYFFRDMGIAYYFISRTGAPYEVVKAALAENFKCLVNENHESY